MPLWPLVLTRVANRIHQDRDNALPNELQELTAVEVLASPLTVAKTLRPDSGRDTARGSPSDYREAFTYPKH